MTNCPVCRKPQPNPRRTMHARCAITAWKQREAERQRARNVHRRRECEDIPDAQIEARIAYSLRLQAYQRRMGLV